MHYNYNKSVALTDAPPTTSETCDCDDGGNSGGVVGGFSAALAIGVVVVVVSVVLNIILFTQLRKKKRLCIHSLLS